MKQSVKAWKLCKTWRNYWSILKSKSTSLAVVPRNIQKDHWTEAFSSSKRWETFCACFCSNLVAQILKLGENTLVKRGLCRNMSAVTVGCGQVLLWGILCEVEISHFKARVKGVLPLYVWCWLCFDPLYVCNLRLHSSHLRCSLPLGSGFKWS